MDFLPETLTRAAHEQGFVLVGFARLHPLSTREDFYRRWLSEGGNASMTYLAKDPELRFDPHRLDARYNCVVSLGYPYAARATPSVDWRAEMRGRIAAYALGRDYHDVVKKRARAVGDVLRQLRPGSITRTYVDTGPVFEREWASDSRIGWFGKNTMILNREHGSYFFLAEIFTDVEFEATTEPYRDHCGTCRRCLDLCPTGALADGYVMRSDLCISYQTIENRGAIPRELRAKLGNWIFGCDICNDVCPWNDDHGSGERAYDQDANDLLPRLPELLALSEEDFGRRFTVSAVKRAKRRGLLRNVAVALGNTRNPDAIVPLTRSIEAESEPLIRSHAAWALGEIGGSAARRALERALRDRDTAVRREAAAALEAN
jgi:epoxyqueuosine reductase